jgi:hypothetical protein
VFVGLNVPVIIFYQATFFIACAFRGKKWFDKGAIALNNVILVALSS